MFIHFRLIVDHLEQFELYSDFNNINLRDIGDTLMSTRLSDRLQT